MIRLTLPVLWTFQVNLRLIVDQWRSLMPCLPLWLSLPPTNC